MPWNKEGLFSDCVGGSVNRFSHIKVVYFGGTGFSVSGFSVFQDWFLTVFFCTDSIVNSENGFFGLFRRFSIFPGSAFLGFWKISGFWLGC